MYSNERSAQLIVALLKRHGIRRVIASPGTTNFGIVGSMQSDPFFEMWSSVDERSAAYIACGMAASTGEPVVLSCTGAPASREYLAGLTEAFYRKLPVIAITSFNGSYNVGQLMPQNIDRTTSQNDVKVFSVDLPPIRDGEDERFFVRKTNEAILACKRRGGGPVHINVSCDYKNSAFGTAKLPDPRVYRRHIIGEGLPTLDGFDRIAVFVGAHRPFSESETAALEAFVTSHDAVVLCDHTSNYHGAKRTLSALAAEGSGRWSESFGVLKPDLVIDIGEVSGDYVTTSFLEQVHAPVWRVSEDGELRDRLHSLTDVFEMRERDFFAAYAKEGKKSGTYWSAWEARRAELLERIPNLPFTNRWIASRIAPLLPAGSVLHMAILNSLRSWNYWEVDPTIDGYCNTGGFGIDGAISTAIGAALAERSRTHFLFCGDLAFFYDMNSLGNRDLPSNLRILMVNNGLGIEFRMPYSPAATLGVGVDEFVAAAGHFRNRSGSGAQTSPAKAWCESLGITYLSACCEQELTDAIEVFLSVESENTVVLECFVDTDDEVAAVGVLHSLDAEAARRERLVKAAKGVLPEGMVKVAKRIAGR